MKTSKQSALLITQSKNIIDTIRSLLEVKTDITIVQSSLEAKKQLRTRSFTSCIVCLGIETWNQFSCRSQLYVSYSNLLICKKRNV